MYNLVVKTLRSHFGINTVIFQQAVHLIMKYYSFTILTIVQQTHTLYFGLFRAIILIGYGIPYTQAATNMVMYTVAVQETISDRPFR